MKSLLALMALVTLFNAQTYAASIPLTEELENRLFALESAQLPTKAKGLARVVYDPSGEASHRAAGTKGLGVFLPAGAVITNTYGYVATALLGPSTIGFQCEDQDNLLAQVDLKMRAAGNMFVGKAAGASSINGGGSTVTSGMLDAIAARCEISVRTPSDGQSAAATAGKIVFFVEHVLSQ